MLCTVVQHIACEDLGSLNEAIERRFIERRTFLMHGTEPPPPAFAASIEEAELVILLGGPMAVYEADRYPFLQRELEAVGRRLAAGGPTVGICLGAQIMAAAAGARVYAGGRQEIGWYPVRLTDEAAADPVLGRMAAGSDLFFHWHGDTFDLPAGARPLGASERFARQGFTLGNHALALQFHLEITPPVLERWLADYEAEHQPSPDVMSAAALREGARLHGPGLTARAHDFFEAWLTRQGM